MMYQTAPEDDYGECPSSRTDSSYVWVGVAGGVDFGSFFKIFDFVNFLISEQL